METQDSIDIAHLQRVALGLQHDPFQHSIPSSVNFDSASTNQPNHPNCQPHSSHHNASPIADRLSSTVFSDIVNTPHNRDPGPSSYQRHETDPMNSTTSDQSKPTPIPGPPSAAMDSASALPSDTQVVSQSVYDSLIQRNGESMYGVSQTGADGATLVTLHEGDSGHIDLLADFDSVRHGTNISPEQDEESNYDGSESSPLAYQPEFFPESQRFVTTTPGTAVRKIRTPRTSTTETPSLSRNPLAGDIESSGGFMGLSQLFKATQAPSSPIVHGHLPELVSDRPSPNIPIQAARVANTMSSPLVQFARESSEPNLNYISMKESQSRRDRSLGERLTRSADDMQSDDPLDQEFNKESSFVENARRQRRLNEETAAQLAALRAPSRSSDRVVFPEPVIMHNDAAGSEEETEQEDEIAPQVPQSQELPQSSEEDKENYNGPPLVIGANSTHDRLSQALAMDSGPSSQVDAIMEDVVQTTQSNSMEGQHQDQSSGRSSQIMVKDSQQSPQPSPRPMPHDLEIQQQPSEMQLDTNPNNTENNNPSPARERSQSSPPPSLPVEGLESTASNEPQTQDIDMVQNTSSNEIGRFSSSNPHGPPKVGPFSHSSQTAPGQKSSSMPSRITETPVNLRPGTGDMARLTSIPETSPSHNQNDWEAQSHGGNPNNEDDDLPPMFPAGSAYRTSQVRGSQGRGALSSPVKTLQSQAQSQILSSPSGRQRRALTEIASDCSPQVDFKVGDFGMDFFTADDEHFSSVVHGSPSRPRKKRRGNLGQTFNTSDTAESPAQQVSTETVHVPATTVRRHSRPARRDANVWEPDSSPQQPIRRRKSRIQKLSTSETQVDRQVSAQKDEPKNLQRPEVVIQISEYQRSLSQQYQSSELTELDFDSEDRPMSESNTANSPPITPRAFTNSSESVEVAPRQVIAVWQGQKRAYYPGTYYGTPAGISESKYTVQFEDSLPVEVAKGLVKRLELRVGDGVKVDMPDVPKVTHIIRGFADKHTKEDLARAASSGYVPQTDIYGHASVIIGLKQRQSLPSGGLNSREHVMKIPISKIYMDNNLWNRFKDRPFTYQPEPAPQAAAFHPHTPSEKSCIAVSPNVLFSRPTQSTSGIFANMAFAVSFKEDKTAKTRIAKLITNNGGSILHDGFTQLFETSSIIPLDSPTKASEKDEPGSSSLRLTPLADNVGFACLIADTYSRREKYMQALALGLPCLAGRWVEDCIASGHVIDWDVYLLPAGDSTYLGGATKSRMMIPTPPSEARLPETIAARPQLLKGKSVLIVTGRGKAEEKRRAYIFLTFALGASRVESVPDLEAAREVIEAQAEASLPCKWDLVYVEDADQASAKSMLTPTPKTQNATPTRGRKRKKSAAFNLSSSTNDFSPIARVVGNEFVCQSLILGKLLRE
ncbi:uncharacterized protein N7483_000857 [Penicillium malachiteum]|uniref:uncharacterized protein n=1 Tax=Penicillium malachiteum TaxID=1324776 RepID=UPI0025490D20|nr:uncharacterized protein N7483_000857 [Penicillium malachiteum]KAJ5735732.1 hypothetical protein N7483_000857 [Penicillium malachiteum]